MLICIISTYDKHGPNWLELSTSPRMMSQDGKEPKPIDGSSLLLCSSFVCSESLPTRSKLKDQSGLSIWLFAEIKLQSLGCLCGDTTCPCRGELEHNLETV